MSTDKHICPQCGGEVTYLVEGKHGFCGYEVQGFEQGFEMLDLPDFMYDDEMKTWDRAVKECIKTCVRSRCGFPGSYVSDLRELLHIDYDWREDEEFMKEFIDED